MFKVIEFYFDIHLVKFENWAPEAGAKMEEVEKYNMRNSTDFFRIATLILDISLILC